MPSDTWDVKIEDPDGSSWVIVQSTWGQWGMTHFCKKHRTRVRRQAWIKDTALDHECEMCSERPPEKLTGFLQLCNWERE